MLMNSKSVVMVSNFSKEDFRKFYNKKPKLESPWFKNLGL